MGKLSQWTGTFTKTGMPVAFYSPLALGANLMLWYKADAGVTSSSGLVTAIASQAPGSAFALTNSPTGRQYTLTSAMQNGLPGLQQTGSVSASDYLSASTSTGTYPPVRWEYTQPFTVIVAMRRNSGVASSREFLFGCCAANSASPQACGWTLLTDSAQHIGLGLIVNQGQTEAAIAGTSTTMVNGNNYIVQCDSNGSGLTTGMTVRVNGVQQTSFTTIRNNLVIGTSTILGNAGNFFGFNPQSQFQEYLSSLDSFFEVIIVNRLLTSQEKTNIDSYLDSKWAIF